MNLEIAADQRWVDTGIDLVAGRTYRLQAQGEWTDQGKSCGPEGYRSRDYPRPLVALLLWAAAPFRRMPTAHWLALVGSTDKRQQFRIGAGRTLLARHSGRLWCFANDVGTRYGNNQGSVDLTVLETKTARKERGRGVWYRLVLLVAVLPCVKTHLAPRRRFLAHQSDFHQLDRPRRSAGWSGRHLLRGQPELLGRAHRAREQRLH